MIEEPKKPCPFCQSWINVDAEICNKCHRNIRTGESLLPTGEVNPKQLKSAAIAVITLLTVLFLVSQWQERMLSPQSAEPDLSAVHSKQLDNSEVLEEAKNFDPEEAYVTTMSQVYCEIVQPIMADQLKIEKLLKDKQGDIRKLQLAKNMLLLEELAHQNGFNDAEDMARAMTNSPNWQELAEEALDAAVKKCDFDLKQYRKLQKIGFKIFSGLEHIKNTHLMSHDMEIVLN